MKSKWVYKTISDICKDVTDFVAAGSFADLRKNVVYNSDPDFAQLIRTTDLKRKFTNSDYVYVSKSAFEYLWRVNLDKDCIILPNVGNCGEVYYVSPNDLPYENNVLGPNAVLVRSYTENQRFLAYAFKGNDFQSQLKSIVGTVAQPKFNKTNLKNLTVPVPPMDEQQRIVAELDLLTEVIDKQKTQLKALDTLAQSIFYDMFGDPIENEKRWDVKPLGDVCNVGSSRRIFANEYVESGIPFYRSKEVIEKSKNKPISIELFISEERYNQLKEDNGIPSIGDLLITAVGTIGEIWVVDSEQPFYFKDGNIIWLSKLSSSVSPSFFKFSLEKLIAEYKKKMTVGSAYSALTIVNLKKMEISVPPLALQQEFADKIQSIEEQKTAVNQSIAETQKLLDYSMDKYFG